MAIRMNMVFSSNTVLCCVISVETFTVSTKFFRRKRRRPLRGLFVHPGDNRLRCRRRVAAEKTFLRKVDFLQGRLERDIHQRTAVAVFRATVLEQATVRGDHQVTLGHDRIIFDEDVAYAIGPTEKIFAVIVADERVELFVRNTLVVTKGHLTQNLVLASAKGGDLVYKDFIEVVLVDDSVHLDADIRIDGTESSKFIRNIFERKRTAIALATNLHVRFMVEGIKRHPHLREQAGKRENIFQVRSVRDYRNFGTASNGRFNHELRLFLEKNRFAADNAQAPTSGSRTKAFRVVICDIFDDLADILGPVPSLVQMVPIAVAEGTAVVTVFNDMPVYHHRNILGETHETAIGILEIVLGIDCVRHGIHPSGHANSS